MKNRFLTLIRRYDNQVIRKVCLQSLHIGLGIMVVFLLGSLVGCAVGNSSRMKMIGNSMEPSLADGQIIIVEPVEEISSLHQGDIVIFEWNGDSLLKRLIALPGQTIEIRQGSIIINGQVYDEPYDVVPPDYEQEPIELGEGEYYVLGDNRNESRDSHNFGPITGEMIKGRVVP